MDLVGSLIAQARVLREQSPENESHIGEFTYRVEGTEVVHYDANGKASMVYSMSEIEDSLTPYQLTLLYQNRRAAIRAV